jgi:hypothetical protein
MEMRFPASQLKREDLPTFGLPTMATEGKATSISKQGTFIRIC